MDEPFTGLDPVNLILLREAFMELRDRGRTLIFSTHQMEAAEALCESVAIVDHGRLVAGGASATSSAPADGERSASPSRATLGPDGSADLPGVEAVRHDADGSELELLPGAEPGSILAAVLAHGASVTSVRGRRAEPRGALHRARRAAFGRGRALAPERVGAPIAAAGGAR